MDTNPHLDRFSKFLKEFQNETDRGASILAGTMIDQKLKDIISNFLIDCKQSNDLLSGGAAPVGTFASRLNLAFSLGLISEHEYNECNLIRKIRNDFAHKFELDFSFKDQKIASLCNNFKAHLPGEAERARDNPRFLFVNGVILLYLNLIYRELYVVQKRLQHRDWELISRDPTYYNNVEIK